MSNGVDINLLASRIDRVQLAVGLQGREREQLLDRMRQMEREGYDFITADGSLELLVREALHPGARPFEVISFEVTTRMLTPGEPRSVASVSVKVDGSIYAGQSTRNGPIEALDAALRGCLSPLYPLVADVKLTDYRVHILEPHLGTAARAAVSIEWTGVDHVWTTMGVSENIIEASWNALWSGVKLELMREGEKDAAVLGLRDESWAV